MGILITLLNSSAYLLYPNSFLGWAALAFLLLLVVLLLYYWRALNKPWGKRQIGLFILLSSIALLTNLFLGLRIRLGDTMPMPGMPRLWNSTSAAWNPSFPVPGIPKMSFQ